MDSNSTPCRSGTSDETLLITRFPDVGIIGRVVGAFCGRPRSAIRFSQQRAYGESHRRVLRTLWCIPSAIRPPSSDFRFLYSFCRFYIHMNIEISDSVQSWLFVVILTFFSNNIIIKMICDGFPNRTSTLDRFLRFYIHFGVSIFMWI